MGIGISVGENHREIGSVSFLHCFFSTISARLESGGWGSRFPALLLHLSQGALTADRVRQAHDELLTIRRELTAFRPSAVVWDIEDRSKRLPWGEDIAPEITSLADYFVTSDGEDLFEVLLGALDEAAISGRGAVIE